MSIKVSHTTVHHVNQTSLDASLKPIRVSV